MRLNFQCVVALSIPSLFACGCNVEHRHSRMVHSSCESEHSHFHKVHRQPEKITINGESVDPTYATYLKVYGAPTCIKEFDEGRICIWIDALGIAKKDPSYCYDVIGGFDEQGLFMSPAEFPSTALDARLRELLNSNYTVFGWFGLAGDCRWCNENLCEPTP